MIPIPFLKEILGGAAAILLIICIALGVALKTSNVRLSASLERAKALEMQTASVGQQLLTSKGIIQRLNEQIRAAEAIGIEAQAYQVKADEYARALDNVEALLSRIQSENVDLRARAANLGTCETYELALRSIAGEMP